MSAGAVVEEEISILEEDSSRRVLPMLLVGLVVAALAAGAVWWYLFREPPEPAPPADGDIVSLEPLTTTVGEAQLRHARVAVAVVLVDGVGPEVVEPKVALLKDALLREVAQMHADELRSAEGSQHLREALSGHAVEIWGEGVVRRVVLTELLVQ